MSIPEGQLHVQVFHIGGKHGYPMPAYARMGYLIKNADVYSFGENLQSGVGVKTSLRHQ